MQQFFTCPALRWLWGALWQQASLPIIAWLVFTFLGIRSCRNYNRLVRQNIAYQDSIIYAQDSELWRLRADTLHAHYENRELYKRLDKRDQEEVIYFEHIQRVDDSELQAKLDSLFGEHAQRSTNNRVGKAPRAGQPAQTASGFTPLISGGNLKPPAFNPYTGWGTTHPVRPVPAN